MGSWVPDELGASCKAHRGKFTQRRMAFAKVSAACSGMWVTARSQGGIYIGVVCGGGLSLWEGLVAGSGGPRVVLTGGLSSCTTMSSSSRVPRVGGRVASAKVTPLAFLALRGVAFPGLVQSIV